MGSFSEIGHDLYTSKTSFCQGYQIQKEKLNVNFKIDDVMLVDTQGFGDTRNSDEQITGFFSLNKVIRECFISKIVLVLEFSSFTNERGNYLLRELNNLK